MVRNSSPLRFTPIKPGEGAEERGGRGSWHAHRGEAEKTAFPPVTYAISPLDLFLAKYFFRISLPYYALPNLIANKTIFPELIGPDLTDQRLLKEVKNLMINQDVWDRTQAECRSLRALLGKENANTRSAQLILTLLQE